MTWVVEFSNPLWLRSFKECGGTGFTIYSVIFPETGKGVLLMSNSDNEGGIFKELLEITIANTYTPWEWRIIFLMIKSYLFYICG